MIKLKINSDPLLKDLLNKSLLTHAQIDTFYIDKLMKNEKLNKKIISRDGKKVTKSSFIRTLKQAKVNVQKATYTIILADYLELISKDSIEQLIKISQMINSTKNIQSDQKHDLIKLLLILIKNFSGEK
jgi:hypothetical protein